MGHVSQTREGLHPDYTVYQEISQGNDRIFVRLPSIPHIIVTNLDIFWCVSTPAPTCSCACKYLLCPKLNGREVHMRAYVGAFNLKGPVQEKFVAQLSGGERNRVHLAKVLTTVLFFILFCHRLWRSHMIRLWAVDSMSFCWMNRQMIWVLIYS